VLPFWKSHPSESPAVRPLPEKVRADTSLDAEDAADLRAAALLFRLEVERAIACRLDPRQGLRSDSYLGAFTTM
jgi:hypothetical protein